MQAVLSEENCSGATENMGQDFKFKLELNNEENKEDEYTEEFQEDEDEDCNDFSFSLAFDGVDTSQISAEDVFSNGQMKPFFPLFDHDRLSAEDFESLKQNDRLPNVKKVFIQAANHDASDLPATPSTSGDDDIAGPFCEWKGKVVEVAPKGCKKSNSTGFSKIWRFRDFVHRSNSDGRDAFVFLNHTPPSGSTKATKSGKKEEKASASVEKEALREKKVNGGEGRVNGNAVGGQVKVKKVGKGKTVRLSAYEIYMRNKSKDDDRRQSYLPYRPELVGFFTNVNGGGLSRNTNPF